MDLLKFKVINHVYIIKPKKYQKSELFSVKIVDDNPNASIIESSTLSIIFVILNLQC